jgi:hypothetical protein
VYYLIDRDAILERRFYVRQNLRLDDAPFVASQAFANFAGANGPAPILPHKSVFERMSVFAVGPCAQRAFSLLRSFRVCIEQWSRL